MNGAGQAANFKFSLDVDLGAGRIHNDVKIGPFEFVSNYALSGAAPELSGPLAVAKPVPALPPAWLGLLGLVLIAGGVWYVRRLPEATPV